MPLLKRAMSKYACDVPAPHRGPEGDALHWHAWEGQAEVLEQKAVDLELERLAAAKAREVARESMSPEDAALDKAMEGEEERVRLIELAASPSQEKLRQSLALGALKGMLTETEAEATERTDKEFEGQYNASNSSKSLHPPREHVQGAKMQTATASQGEDLTAAGSRGGSRPGEEELTYDGHIIDTGYVTPSEEELTLAAEDKHRKSEEKRHNNAEQSGEERRAQVHQMQSHHRHAMLHGAARTAATVSAIEHT